MNRERTIKCGCTIRWANELRLLDILCIQEHNGSRDKLGSWKSEAHRAGFCLTQGADRGPKVRGGTVILARKSTFGLENEESALHSELPWWRSDENEGRMGGKDTTLCQHVRSGTTGQAASVRCSLANYSWVSAP